MTTSINVNSLCGEFCIDENDVKKLSKSILLELKQNNTIELDFTGTDTVLTAFLSSLIGELCDKYEINFIKNSIKFSKNTDKSIIEKFNSSLSNAKKFHKSTKKERDNIREKINMLFNEVDLNESYSHTAS